jgi:hypothetical protein
MLKTQQAVPCIWPRMLNAVVFSMRYRRLTKWAFDRYLGIAHPHFAGPAPTPRVPRGAVTQRTAA